MNETNISNKVEAKKKRKSFKSYLRLCFQTKPKHPRLNFGSDVDTNTVSKKTSWQEARDIWGGRYNWKLIMPSLSRYAWLTSQKSHQDMRIY